MSFSFVFLSSSFSSTHSSGQLFVCFFTEMGGINSNNNNNNSSTVGHRNVAIHRSAVHRHPNNVVVHRNVVVLHTIVLCLDDHLCHRHHRHHPLIHANVTCRRGRVVLPVHWKTGNWWRRVKLWYENEH